MSDLEQWKEWLDKWKVEYYEDEDEDDEYRGEPTTQISITGSYASACIVFKKETHEFMHVSAFY